MEKKSIFREISQVGMVVRDLDKSIKRQWEEYGIGPWAIYTMDPSNLRHTEIRGKRIDYAIRVGLATVGGISWELIQPLDDESVYAEFLREHGEGLHHVCFKVDDFDETMAHFKKKGGVLSSGSWHDVTFAYFDTADSLHAISEITMELKKGKMPTPEATYP